jgi:uncharacterized membrane protein YkvA (DUF1232 family)
MAADKNRNVLRAGGGFFDDLLMYMKLIVRLVADKRVHPLLKLLPIGSLLYLIFPLDVPGPLDDAAVVGMGMMLFIELCPPEVVNEHKLALQGGLFGGGQPAADREQKIDEADIIEAEYRED